MNLKKHSFFRDYFHTQYANRTQVDRYYRQYFVYTEKSIGDILSDPNKSILDLWCGFWGFAYYCQKKWFKNYIGIDLSTDELQIARKHMQNYTFIESDIFSFLRNTRSTYDVIFMSMVFEHLSLEEAWEIILLISKKLSPNGLFINYQPNADSYFNSTASLYIDITHERLWGQDSYTQLMRSQKVNGNLSFRNSYVGWNIFWHSLHILFLWVFKLIIKVLWYDTKPIYTKSFYSILSFNGSD